MAVAPLAPRAKSVDGGPVSCSRPWLAFGGPRRGSALPITFQFFRKFQRGLYSGCHMERKSAESSRELPMVASRPLAMGECVTPLGNPGFPPEFHSTLTVMMHHSMGNVSMEFPLLYGSSHGPNLHILCLPG